MIQDNVYHGNIAAYERMKATIEQTYPHGWFVGIADDRVVGAAADFRELERLILTQGKDPRHVLVVEAGIAYPEHVTIFTF